MIATISRGVFLLFAFPALKVATTVLWFGKPFPALKNTPESFGNRSVQNLLEGDRVQ